MKLSIIIPARNSAKTIRYALYSLFASNAKDFETIVVNDASSDDTESVVKEFPCKLINLSVPRGTAYARKIGMENATGDINVFIDSDICIKKDTLDKVIGIFSRHKDAIALVGILSKEHHNNNFFSLYKNLYMHYILNSCPQEIDFIYGSFYALKKGYGAVNLKTNKFVEDTELGMRLKKAGHRIILDNTLEVVHLKKYTLLSFIKNDFIVPYCWSKIFIQQKSWSSLVKEKRFCHAGSRQLTSICIASLITPVILINPRIGAVLAAAFIAINKNFFIFLGKERGCLFMVKSIFVTFADQLVMTLGVVTGFATSCFGLGNDFFQKKIYSENNKKL